MPIALWRFDPCVALKSVRFLEPPPVIAQAAVRRNTLSTYSPQGSVAVAPDGTFVYTPNAGGVLADGFTVTGLNGEDTIIGSLGNDALYGTGGVDSILGGMSNVLIRDGGVRGVVIRLGAGFAGIERLDDRTVRLGAACRPGLLWPRCC